MMGICGFMMGTFIGIIFSTAEHAVQMLPLILIPVIIFGGLPVNLNQIPAYVRWIQYLSALRHSYSALLIDQLSTAKLHKINDDPEVRELLGINGEFVENILYLGAIVIAMMILSIACLYIKRKPL